MKIAEDIRIARLAKNLWLTSHGRYVFVQDVANSNILKASASSIETPSLKKLGKFVYNCPYFSEETFIPSALDIYNNLPNRYSSDCFLKRAHAFSVRSKKIKKDIDGHDYVPIVVTLYGLRRNQTAPQILDHQNITVHTQKFNVKSLKNLEQYI